MTSKDFLRDGLGWGVLLWFIGYFLGILLFFVVPASFIGWILTPLASVLTIFVLLKKITGNTMNYYLVIAIMWTTTAIAGDYFLLVKVFNPPDGYYKPDVYLYYTLTFLFPLIVGWRKLAAK